MIGIPEVDAILTSVKTASRIGKLINDSWDTLDKAEARLKLAELVSSLADTKMEVGEIVEILRSKDIEIRELKSELEIKGSMEFEAPVYWLANDDHKDGPFCQQCWDAESKPCRLQNYEIKPGFAVSGMKMPPNIPAYKCVVCDNVYKKDGGV